MTNQPETAADKQHNAEVLNNVIGLQERAADLERQLAESKSCVTCFKPEYLTQGLPPESEFALRCIEYRKQLYGCDGPGSDEEVYQAELIRCRNGHDELVDLALERNIEITRLKSDNESARQSLMDVMMPFVFDEQGIPDDDAPLSKVAPLAAEKILHLRKLHSEMCEAELQRSIECGRLSDELEQRRADFLATEQRHLNQIAALKAKSVEVDQLQAECERIRKFYEALEGDYKVMNDSHIAEIARLKADLEAVDNDRVHTCQLLEAARRDGERLRLACGQVFLELEERFSQSCRDANGEWKWDGATRFGLEAAIKIARHHLGDAIDAATGKAGE